MKKKSIIIISAIVCVLLLLSGFFIFRSCDKDEPNTPSLPQDSNAVDWNGQQQLLEGEYSGYLKIQVFKTDGKEVNGAKVAFNLLVTSEVQE